MTETKLPELEGFYAVRLIEVVGHNLLIAEIVTTGPHKGLRVHLQMPPFHIKVANGHVQFHMGKKPYKERGT